MTTTLSVWWQAFRPKTLTAAVAPVLMGTAMAYGDGLAHWPSAAVCLLAAVMIQIGTNLANDYFDCRKGADTADRLGPTRVTQAGLIRPEAVRGAFVGAFALAGLACAWLVQRGGWPIALLGIVSILSGLFYTAGPRPLGYLGLGDLFVLVFFGPVAVGGTYYVQSLEINAAVIWAGFGPGLIATAILAVNNLRDRCTDQRCGKKTLAVRFGAEFTRYEYMTALFLAALLPVAVYGFIDDHRGILATPVVLLPAMPVLKTVLTTDGPALNTALADTGRLLLIYSVVFSMGWIV